MSKKKLLVSFSGGETSAFMAQWLLKNKKEEYEMCFIFANTGEENEETLTFIERCDKEWGLNVVWVECLVNQEMGKGTTHKVVNYKSASRKGQPFEAVISKYGIPNQMFPHCNREMKLRPIHSYIKNELKWEHYYTAIGIRYDEVDRMVADRSIYNIVYPLIEDIKMTKPKINYWWSKQPFRLNLKGYQGNCKTCWKKSKKNLCKIANENPNHFDFMRSMELKYSYFTPEGRKEVLDENGNKAPIHFFRGNLSVEDIFELSKHINGNVVDSSAQINYQLDIFDLMDESEHCDILTGCGDNVK